MAFGRSLHTIQFGERIVVVKQDSETQEYRARLFTYGQPHKDADYFTEDLDDAKATAERMLKPWNEQPAAHRQTNTEWLTDLMDFSKAGPLMQAFVLEAIAKYAKRCAEAESSTFDSPMLSGTAWQRCAVEAQTALAKHLGT